MNLTAVAGMPRSGSTLLCNILAQNPEFTVSSTSPTAPLIDGVLRFAQENTEIQAAYISGEGPDRLANLCRGMILGWYHGATGMVFDKCRYWTNMGLQFYTLFPGGRMILCVRDIKEIMASIETAHRRQSLITPNGGPSLTSRERTDALIQPDGLVGQGVRGLMDMADRGLLKSAYVCRYDRLCADPKKVIGEIYAYIEMPEYAHNFEEVNDSAVDLDGIYWHKFPHHHRPGPVRRHDPAAWRDVLPVDMGKILDQTFQRYREVFGYV